MDWAASTEKASSSGSNSVSPKDKSTVLKEKPRITYGKSTVTAEPTPQTP